jgi:hypothetical protein
MSRARSPPSPSGRLTNRSAMSITSAVALSRPPRTSAVSISDRAASWGVPARTICESSASLGMAPWTPSVQRSSLSPRERSTNAVSSCTRGATPIALTSGFWAGGGECLEMLPFAISDSWSP